MTTPDNSTPKSKLSKKTAVVFKKIQIPEKSSAIAKEFIAFINRGNVLELAVGILIGGSFGKIVSSLVSDIIMPIVSLLLGGLNFNSLAIEVPNLFGANTSARIAYGTFIQNVVDFLVIAAVIFFIIRFFNRLSNLADNEAKITPPATDPKSNLKKEITKVLKP